MPLKARVLAPPHATGDAAWLFAAAHLEGTELIERLRRETNEDAIIAVWGAFKGAFKGAIEFAPRLLWPQLLARENLLEPDATAHRGRPISPFVLVSDGAALRLEVR
ncbi:MAG: hypothetical protein ACON4Z_16995 [Planctomycetota bacterium]